MSGLVAVAIESPTAPGVADLVRAGDAFMNSLYPSDACESLDLDELAAPGVTVVVARDAAGVAIGMGALVERGDGSGELKRLFVDAAGRGRGVAGGILDVIESTALARGVRTLQLQTGPGHVAAIALYERRGYARIAAFEPYVGDGFSVCMEKALG